MDLRPLGIRDIVYRRSPEYLAKQVNLVTPVVRDGKTSFAPAPFTNPINPIACQGGGGLHGSAASFIKILQALLNDGLYAPTSARILTKETVDQLFMPQFTDAQSDLRRTAEEWMKFENDPFHRSTSNGGDSETVQSRKRGFGLGSGVNLEDLEGGRKAGTLFGSGFGCGCYLPTPSQLTH